ncbi:MAG: cyclic nucleotide-binding domain-containing protein [Spirochaetota bacterium]
MIRKSNFNRGAYIYIEGDEDVDDIFIVENGVIQLTNYNSNVPRIKSTINQGEVFGVISSLSNRPRIESAVAATDVTNDSFPSFLTDSPASKVP